MAGLIACAKEVAVLGLDVITGAGIDSLVVVAAVVQPYHGSRHKFDSTLEYCK